MARAGPPPTLWLTGFGRSTIAFVAAAGANYGTVNDLGASFSANFMGDTNTDMNYAFYNAMGPAVRTSRSPVGSSESTMLAGHCNSFPTENSTTIMGMDDMSNSGTMTRASLWQYTAMLDTTTPDLETTIARDAGPCALASG